MKNRITLLRIIPGIIGLLFLNACSISAKHPALLSTDLTELVPVRDFVANLDYNGRYRLSPDGSNISWAGVDGLSSAILWRSIDSKNAQAIKFDKNSPRAIWAPDSQHIFYHHDDSGRENTHVYVVDTQDPALNRRNLTPYPGTKAYILKVPYQVSDQIFIMHNRRNAEIFDLYSVNYIDGTETLIHENNDNIVSLFIDDEGALRARVKQTNSERLLQVPAENGHWNTLVVASKFDQIHPVDLSLDGSLLYMFSDVGRDKKELVLLDLETGDEKIIYRHDKVDAGYVYMSKQRRRPLYAVSTPGYPEVTYFDEALRMQMEAVIDTHPMGVDITSMDRSERYATIVTWDHMGAKHYLADLKTGKRELLAEGATLSRASTWVEQKPISFLASDGLQLNGYLALPKGSGSKPLPTVLLVHGGPWARDWWGHHTGTQFYANRGYAVLRVNYRGSHGYGREYMDAGIGEFAGKMHQDLIDAIDWAIDHGISDAENIAIVGGSYGGYATLVGMTMTPERFACGIDIVGVSDLATLVEDFPAYWKPSEHYWTKFVGDPKDPAQRKIMDAKSPLNYTHQMQSPLLVYHGENDPRVKLDQSDRMVASLKEAGKDVEYVVIEDEGHGFGHWKNQLDYYRDAEDFLAKCIGGRSSGFDYYQLGSWMF
jgi:dipeptidyl aminopeptidase/acylaminoacyl peptidase